MVERVILSFFSPSKLLQNEQNEWFYCTIQFIYEHEQFCLIQKRIQNRIQIWDVHSSEVHLDLRCTHMYVIPDWIAAAVIWILL